MAELNIGEAFDLPPEEAIAWFESKGLKVNPDTWAAVEATAHSTAFTVAHLASVDILQSIFDEVDKALKDGTTFADFQANLVPLMQQAGWWGKDEDGVQLGSPHRLATIFRTNLQSAYMRGRVKGMLENVEARPWWEYVAVLDNRTRPAHRQLDGRVYRYDDPFWKSFTPPIGWMCRCRISALSDANLESRGITPETGNVIIRDVDVNGHRQPQGVYIDPMTGNEIKTDVGWGTDRMEPYRPDPSKYDPSLQPIVEDINAS